MIVQGRPQVDLGSSGGFQSKNVMIPLKLNKKGYSSVLIPADGHFLCFVMFNFVA